MPGAPASLYRLLPSVAEADLYLQKHGLPFGKSVRASVQEVLQGLRKKIAAASLDPTPFPFATKEHILEHLASLVGQQKGGMRRVVNATGVVIHTNLGRSPISKPLIESILPLLSSYATVEYDLKTGKRGSRTGKVNSHLRTLAGAEDAVAVNNNAAAVYLMLMALASGKEVIVSRGELIEIGGSFRVPDIMEAAGVKLIEVGTTNRTRLSDYEKAISENTAALMKVHPSNYRIEGFAEEVSMQQIAQLAQERKLLSFYDLGSGNFYRFAQPALQNLLTVQQELRSGADLVTFSGDKLLGSTQAGIVVGKKNLIAALSQHPLYRALRLDKITLALLEVHLAAYFQIPTLPETIPTLGMLEQTPADIQQKAQTVFQTLPMPLKKNWHCHLEEASSLAGGGALPQVALPSHCLVLHHEKKPAEEIQTFLRQQEVPIIGRIRNNQVWLDFRTIFPEDFPLITETLQGLFAS